MNASMNMDVRTSEWMPKDAKRMPKASKPKQESVCTRNWRLLITVHLGKIFTINRIRRFAEPGDGRLPRSSCRYCR